MGFVKLKRFLNVLAALDQSPKQEIEQKQETNLCILVMLVLNFDIIAT